MGIQPEPNSATTVGKVRPQSGSLITQGDFKGQRSAVVEITTADGSMYLESGHPDKVEIGEINLPDGMKIDLKTNGKFEVGKVNVGTEQVVGQVQTSLPFDPTAPEVVFIAALAIVFTVIGVLGWRALSIELR
jgi:hypothetical protein